MIAVSGDPPQCHPELRLSYYQQREWRIIVGMLKEGVRVTVEATEAQKAELLALDPEFFGRELDFPRGSRRIVDHCELLAGKRDTGILALARRIIGPRAAVPAIKELLGSGAPPVIAIEEIELR